MTPISTTLTTLPTFTTLTTPHHTPGTLRTEPARIKLCDLPTARPQWPVTPRALSSRQGCHARCAALAAMRWPSASASAHALHDPHAALLLIGSEYLPSEAHPTALYDLHTHTPCACACACLCLCLLVPLLLCSLIAAAPGPRTVSARCEAHNLCSLPRRISARNASSRSSALDWPCAGLR